MLSSSHADGTKFRDTLSLSLCLCLSVSFTNHPYHPSLLAGLLGCI